MPARLAIWLRENFVDRLSAGKTCLGAQINQMSRKPNETMTEVKWGMHTKNLLMPQLMRKDTQKLGLLPSFGRFGGDIMKAFSKMSLHGFR